MKSKYFIRGFGVGVLITAIIVAGFSMVKTTVQKQPSDGADKTVVASAQPTDPANDSTAAPVESEAAGTAAPTSKPAVSEKPGETAAPASTEKPNTDNGTSTAAPGRMSRNFTVPWIMSARRLRQVFRREAARRLC